MSVCMYGCTLCMSVRAWVCLKLCMNVFSTHACIHICKSVCVYLSMFSFNNDRPSSDAAWIRLIAEPTGAERFGGTPKYLTLLYERKQQLCYE